MSEREPLESVIERVSGDIIPDSDDAISLDLTRLLDALAAYRAFAEAVERPLREAAIVDEVPDCQQALHLLAKARQS